MSSPAANIFVTAMDKHTPVQLGENLHAEYGWSNNIKEKIVQLSFQLVRTSPENAQKIASQLYALVLNCKNSRGLDNESHELTDTLRRLVISTRDVESGKGEWALSYELIKSWYQVYPDEAKKMIKYLVTDLPLEGSGGKCHPYGSWKDIKQLWRVFGGPQCPSDMLNYLVSLVNDQLRKDVEDRYPSLCAKWVPRERGARKSKIPFKPLYHALAEDYYSHYLATAKTPGARIGAQRKAYTHYRETVLTPLNRYLDTVQIHQCANRYDLINYTNVPSVAMKKQTKAFLNLDKNGEERCETENRRVGAMNFANYIETCEKGEATMKGKRVGLVDFITPWMNYGAKMSPAELSVLNAQWDDAGKSISKLGNFIAMVDTSGSMSGDPMHAAIGLGLRVAEKSRLGRRVMTFSEQPNWVNLEGTTSLSEMVGVVKNNMNNWGMNTNFTAAMKMILDVCVTNKIPPIEVQDMVLAVFSDMQIDAQGNESLSQSMWQYIGKLYHDAGMKAFGEPYKPPHVLFWNLRQTSGFPVLSDQKGATMFSGFSPALLNNFAENGMDALKDCDPWTMLKQQLSNERYNILSFN